MKYFSSRFYKKLIVLILSFYLCAWFFYWISGSQLRYETIIEKQEEITGSIGELSEGSTESRNKRICETAVFWQRTGSKHMYGVHVPL